MPTSGKTPTLRVLNIPGGQDTGGNGFRTMDAFRRLRPDWTYDLCTGKVTYIGYPVGKPMTEALDLWKRADVIHHRNSFYMQDKLGAPARPSIIHHHGTNYRALHESLLAQAAGSRAISVCATLDLQLIHPDDTEWLPTPYDLTWLASFRQPREDDGVLRIGHAPTDRRVKSTARLLAAVERLRGDGVKVEVEMIEKATWSECLRRKGTVDVYFDQVQLGYGNNAIEAWGMGVPVIAGAQPDTLDEMVRRFGSLPFIPADESTIYDALVQAADPVERKVWADRGLAHVRQWHDERVLIDHLVDLYTRAVDRW